VEATVLDDILSASLLVVGAAVLICCAAAHTADAGIAAVPLTQRAAG
jgi:hypothetical protein